MSTPTEFIRVEELQVQAARLRKKGKWSQALSCYERIFTQDPSNWENLIAMGDAYLNIQEWVSAAKAYRASLEIKDDFDWAWHNLCVALFNVGDLAGVASCYRSLQLINPLFWDTNQSSEIVSKYRSVFTEMLATTHAASSAAAANSTSVSIANGDSLSSPIGGQPTLLQFGGVSPAEPSVPDNIFAKDSIAKDSIAKDSITKDSIANSYLSEDDARQFESFYRGAKVLAQQGNHSEAVDAYRHAIVLHKNHPEIYHYLGDSLLNLGRIDEAISAYKTSLRYNPDDNWTYFNLSVSFMRDGKPRRATKYLRELIERDPNFSEAHLLLGNALEAQEKWAGAVDAYSYYLEKIDPDNTAVADKLNELLPKSAEAVIHELAKHLKRTPRSPSPRSQETESLSAAKSHLEKLNAIALDTFLTTGSLMRFPVVKSAKITIILVLYNRAELTFSCLNSILSSGFKSVEIVIIDNNSTDRTRQLLGRIEGAKIVLNDDNKHFLRACNQASQLATGENILFLNNDAQILGNSLENALRTLESSPDIGAVGGKVILPDGSLQEAGSLIWQDGSCLGYGRGDDPSAPQYMFERTVDYCSGAFLLTPRQLFLELGGFDEMLQPAYYEETDYCVGLAKQGKKLIYDPSVAILHYEFGSSGSSEKAGQAIDLQKRNKKIFRAKHESWLARKHPPALGNVLAARMVLSGRRKVLFIEDRIPHRYYGSGHTRGNTILRALLGQNCFVTIFPTDLSYDEDWSTAYSDIPRSVELMSGYGRDRLKEFLLERAHYYDLVLVSRPHNMEALSDVIETTDALTGAKVIYDAEAIFCEREFLEMKLAGENPSESFIQEELSKELSLCRNAHHILSVSKKEANRFRELGYASVSVLGHVLEVKPTPKAFDERKDILFVGAIYDISSPNADSVLWFAKEVFPIIQSLLGPSIRFLVAGTNTVPELNDEVAQLGNSAIEMIGRVDDLTALYNDARIFVVPTRFAAGIPHKAHEAAARGIPMVTTSLISSQLGWTIGEQLLAADTAASFAEQCVALYTKSDMWSHVREKSIARVSADCNLESFNSSLSKALLP